LAARRLSEPGVRFVQVYHGTGGNAWDLHKDLKKNHAEQSAKVDKPIAGLIKDLKQRGMLEDTLVVWRPNSDVRRAAKAPTAATTTPMGSQSGWQARASKKASSTGELGFNAVENRHYVTDIHATVFHQLGLDPWRLEVPGQNTLISITATQSKRFWRRSESIQEICRLTIRGRPFYPRPRNL
jgi:hypothetical protein